MQPPDGVHKSDRENVASQPKCTLLIDETADVTASVSMPPINFSHHVFHPLAVIALRTMLIKSILALFAIMMTVQLVDAQCVCQTKPGGGLRCECHWGDTDVEEGAVKVSQAN